MLRSNELLTAYPIFAENQFVIKYVYDNFLTMSHFHQDSIFWIDTDKIKPNPFQPRREFDPVALQALADSIRQYGVLQALVVTRKEVVKPDGGLNTEYELIAGERRLRAARLAGVREVPCLIKVGEENDLLKLELAIIENVQREDLNAVDRARAFRRLIDEFSFKQMHIAEKIGKSREYVANTLRILDLPEVMLAAVSAGTISEGHTRPLLMLASRPAEQETLFKEIIAKKLTVRDAERIARHIAVERAHKKNPLFDQDMIDIERKLADTLGTRVHIEKRESGGKVTIDFFSKDDLQMLLNLVNGTMASTAVGAAGVTGAAQTPAATGAVAPETVSSEVSEAAQPARAEDDRTPAEIKQEENEDIYSIKNFSL